jgi:Protein of unknown function (DUF2961).
MNKITYNDMLSRLTDLKSLATYSDERCIEASSYERLSRYDTETDTYVNWDANDDDGHDTPRLPGGEFVFADIDGPGAIVRIWSAQPEDGHIKIYLDGSGIPAVDRPFRELFEGDAPFDNHELCYDAARGKNCFVPITFQNGCRIIADEGWGRYYQINYIKFPAGTQVETFSEGLVPTADYSLNTAEPRHSVKISPHASVDIANFVGAGAVSSIALKLSENCDMQKALSKLSIFAYWDGEGSPSVCSPLSGFFSTFNGASGESLPVGVLSSGTLYNNFYMPYSDGARLIITNESDEEYSISYVVSTETLDKNAANELLRFHAKWEKVCDPPKGERHPDALLLSTKGKGRFVGMVLHVYKPIGEGDPENHPEWWWGEGDEKFFIDGEKFPSWFGTGCEDYFGYAWGDSALFWRPYHSQSYCEGGQWGAGHRLNSRFHVIDSIPFAESFEGYIEKYHRDEYSAFDATVFWYLEC